MILLDTNVISEPLRREPHPRVIDWLDAQPMETLFLSSITVAELRAGVARLPAGKRRAALKHSLEHRVLPLFAGRVLPFDLAGTEPYAALTTKAQARGLTLGTADALIAAIALAHGLAVATRDTRPFSAAGVPVIQPWSDGVAFQA